jgi:phosphatidylserine/phosphatidylglycerophosphate/cardiolipin synthase-like enzyme
MRKYLGLVMLLLLLISPVQATESNESWQLVFDPQLRSLIRDSIAETQKSIIVEVYKITDRGVISDLAQAAKRGIGVRIILCPSQKSNYKAAQKLSQAGVQVRWYPVQRKNQIMHLKLGCFDQTKLVFGSPNWTYWGLTLHHEGVLVIRQSDVIQNMLKQFEKDWDKSWEKYPQKSGAFGGTAPI